MEQEKRILDVACGPMHFYFDKNFPGLVTMDRRKVDKIIYPDNPLAKKRIHINPDVVGDFRDIPFPDDTFYMVVFDPPHLKWTHEESIMGETYGVLNDATWAMDIQEGFIECMRVLKPNGTLIFKWNDHDITLDELLRAIPYKPIFGNQNRKGRTTTHWLVFMK